jgi:hypothetical protein
MATDEPLFLTWADFFASFSFLKTDAVNEWILIG